MRNIFKATLYRVFKSKGVRMAVILTYISAILYYILAYMIASGKMEAASAGNVTALADPLIIWLFGSLMIGLIVGSDFENKTIHGAIGYGRGRIIINYINVYIAMMLILLLPYIIGSVVIVASGSGMSIASGTAVSIFMDNAIKYNDGISMWKLLLSYIAYVFVMVGQLSICIPVAVKFRKTTVVTAFGFLFGMLTSLITTLVSKIEILDNIYKLAPYNYGVSKLGLDARFSDMCLGIVVSVIFILICTVLASLVFRKADIK